MSRHDRNLRARDPPVAEGREPIKYTRRRRDRARALGDLHLRNWKWTSGIVTRRIRSYSESPEAILIIGIAEQAEENDDCFNSETLIIAKSRAARALKITD